MENKTNGYQPSSLPDEEMPTPPSHGSNVRECSASCLDSEKAMGIGREFKTFIFVEDGSVDVDELQDDLCEDTKVVVYRQGSTIPTIVQPEKPIKGINYLCYRDTKDILERILGMYDLTPDDNEAITNLLNNYYRKEI